MATAIRERRRVRPLSRPIRCTARHALWSRQLTSSPHAALPPHNRPHSAEGRWVHGARAEAERLWSRRAQGRRVPAS
eukprot:7342246-Prymnesium_polylepis.1